MQSRLISWETLFATALVGLGVGHAQSSIGLDYVADRSNAVVDIFSTSSLSLVVGRILCPRRAVELLTASPYLEVQCR